MVKTYIAHTDEVDDADLAIEQIQSQLGLDKNLLTHSIGIIACHYEFVESGVVKAVCDALPFDVAGTISSLIAIPGKADSLLLTIMVITSDDTEFVSVLTPSLETDPNGVISEAYKNATAGRTEKPAMILTYAPFLTQHSGDDYVNIVTEASEGAPCFGTLAVDDTADFSNCFMLFNGTHYKDRMSLVLAYGKIKPRFFIVNVSEGKVMDKSAIITKSKGHVIEEVNGRPIAEFFESLGLTKASEVSFGLSMLPFLLDYNDGTPRVSKVIIRLTPERYALCAGATPEGSTFHIAMPDKDDILMTSEQGMDEILEHIEGMSGCLIYSCIARSMMMGKELFDEIDTVSKKLSGNLEFMMAYSGGEICPTQTADTKITNRFHNNALIACLF